MLTPILRTMYAEIGLSRGQAWQSQIRDEHLRILIQNSGVFRVTGMVIPAFRLLEC